MKALVGGRSRSLDDLMERWKNPIAGYIYKIVGNYHDAVELTQEVFVKVYFEAQKFDLNKPFGPWLYTIAGNLAKNKLRWRFIRRSEEINEETLATTPLNLTGEEGVLMECLQKLPTDLREAVVLFDIEERSHEEIAEIIGKSRKTVEARLYKGRELLKKAYLEKNTAEPCL